MYITGNNTRINISGQPIQGETKCSISVKLRTHDYADVSNPDWRSLLRDQYGWTAQADGLATQSNVRMLLQHWMLRTELSLTIVIDDITFRGSAYVSGVVYSGKTSKTATWSVSFQGTGPLSV